MKKCPRCAEDNPDENRFCSNCGAKLLDDSIDNMYYPREDTYSIEDTQANYQPRRISIFSKEFLNSSSLLKIKKSIIPFLLIVFLFSVPIMIVRCTNPTDSDAIAASKEIIQNYLKNPNSVQYHQATVACKDTSQDKYIVYLDLSSVNGFGGYTRDHLYIFCQFKSGSSKIYSYDTSFPYWNADVYALNHVKKRYNMS